MVRPLHGCVPERFPTVTGGIDAEALPFEVPDDDVAHGLIVFDDEHVHATRVGLPTRVLRRGRRISRIVSIRAAHI